ncbi:MAG TPA: hypothetical protein VGV59_02795 [Pyrinomonadaceae bacterium]|nr:hypothetical protein [Pyrinomonadaceae bacterium]
MRCSNCHVESELDSNYCRKCGMPMKVPPKGSADSSATESQKSEKSANPNSTSELNGVKFPNKKAAKKVVPLDLGDDNATGRQLGRKLQTMFVFIVILAILQVVVIVAVLIWSRQPAPQQARMDVQTPSMQTEPNVTRETSPAEAAPQEPARAEIKETSEEQKESAVQEKEQYIESLEQKEAAIQRRINEKQLKLKKLNKELAVAENELAGVRGQIAEASLTLKALKEDIARATRTRKKGQMATAHVTRKRANVAQLEQKVKGLRGVETQKARRVKDLRMQIAGVKNLDDSSKNRRTRRKLRSGLTD